MMRTQGSGCGIVANVNSDHWFFTNGSAHCSPLPFERSFGG